MLKKRVIFTLLYENGKFVLSRNFRLQKVGDINWLKNNYNFSKIAFHIDELIVLNVSRGASHFENFCETLKSLAKDCFVPIAAGGWIRSLEQAKMLLRSGADKVVLNTPLFKHHELVRQIFEEYGQQCITGSLDVEKSVDNNFHIITNSCLNPEKLELEKGFISMEKGWVGELYLNSINQDGTGNGYDFTTLNILPESLRIPIIMAGGVGNSKHLLQGLKDDRIDAVATAHLFNFVGDGLMKARLDLINEKQKLANWPEIEKIKNFV